MSNRQSDIKNPFPAGSQISPSEKLGLSFKTLIMPGVPELKAAAPSLEDLQFNKVAELRKQFAG